MKRNLLILFCLANIFVMGQDYSFSQFDLNLMYSNPAFAGYDNNNRVLFHRKNQWMGIPEKFNSNIIEFNLSHELRKQGLGHGKVTWAGGIYIIEDHENTVMKKYQIGITPWSFHYQLPKNFFLSLGIQNVISYNTLDWDKLIFSDEIDAFGETGNETSANAPYYLKYTNWFDPSFGLIITKHSQNQKSTDQTSFIGLSVHHLNSVIESFYNNQTETSKHPIKYTIHGEHLANIPDFLSRNFKYWKMFFRHETQTKNMMQKDELGLSTTLSNKLQIELGTIYRLGRYSQNENTRIMSESIIPIIRIRLKASRKIGMEIGYSYDFNISKLENINTIATNEININFYFIKGKTSICPANGKWGNNKKWTGTN
jgi:type IX secretion system PorP/SprF family membrane protein